jgi:hypothetical protein
MFTKTHVMRLLLLIMILGGFELQAQFSQTLKIKANSGIPVLSEPLKSGVEYRITVRGEFSIWPEYLGNGVDAGYIYDVPKARIDNNLWPAERYINVGTGDTIIGIPLPAWVGNSQTFPATAEQRSVFPFFEFNFKKWTGFRVDGEPLMDTDYEPVNHQYQFLKIGKGKTLSFSIIDSLLQPPMEDPIASYADNSGELTVLIEEVLPFNVNICSSTPILNADKKMKGIKVDVSVIADDTNNVKGRKNILFDKNQVAIYENGAFICPDTIYCNKTVEAVSIAMVFDRSGSMKFDVSDTDSSKTIRIDAAMKSGAEFVNNLGAKDEILLISFSDSNDIEPDVNWTSNKKMITDKINAYANRLGNSKTALHSALKKAITETELYQNRVRAVVALTDGANNVAPENEQEVIDALPKAGNIPVFIIALGMDTVYNTSLTDPILKRDDSLNVQDNRAGLFKMKRITDASKGRLFLVTQTKVLDSIYALISNGIREEECCTIEYKIKDCENDLADTVRTVVVYYPYQGGVSAQAITYKTSCAKSFLSRRASGDQLYEKSVFIKRDKSHILVPVSLTKSEQVRIDLIDKSGKRIKSVYQSRLAKGEHSIVVNAKNLQAGEYTAEVFVKGKKLSQHDITIQE